MCVIYLSKKLPDPSPSAMGKNALWHIIPAHNFFCFRLRHELAPNGRIIIRALVQHAPQVDTQILTNQINSANYAATKPFCGAGSRNPIGR